jgi:hypothetical protein
MYAVKQAPKNSAASGKKGNGPVPRMGSATRADRIFKNPSAGSKKPMKMGRSVPGSKTGN